MKTKSNISLILSVISLLLLTLVIIGFLWLKLDLTKVQDSLGSIEELIDDKALKPPLNQDGTVNNQLNQGFEGLENSPINHSVHVTFSDNPEDFSIVDEAIFDSASVPDVVKLHTDSVAGNKNDLILYFPSFTEFRGAGDERLAFSKSTDNGKTWSEIDYIELEGKTNVGAPVDPSAVQLDDGRIRIYYFGSEMTKSDPAKQEGEHKFYSAISDDGKKFVVEEGVRFSQEGVTDPEVIQTANNWIMYISNGQQTLIAQAEDGLNFELTEYTWDGGGVPGAYVDANDNVHLYGCNQGINTQVSKDGLHFNEDEAYAKAMDDKGESVLCDPSPVLLDDGTVLMIYKKQPMPEKIIEPHNDTSNNI